MEDCSLGSKLSIGFYTATVSGKVFAILAQMTVVYKARYGH